MSSKRLNWLGLACLVLSALTVGLGFIIQIGIILTVVLLVPIFAIGGADGTISVPVPRVLPPILLVAGLFLSAALVSFVESRRRARRRTRCVDPSPG